MSLNTEEVDWLWSAASYIARFQEATEVTSRHLWIAIMANVHSHWARLIDDYGGGVYADADTSHCRLPPLWTVPEFEPALPAVHISVYRMFIRRSTALWLAIRMSFRSRQPPAPLLPESPQARTIRNLASELSGGNPTIGYYLVVMASMPGPHQPMLDRRSAVMAAAARRDLGIARPGDNFRLAIDRPRYKARELRRWVKTPEKEPSREPVRKIVSVLWWIGGALWATFKVLGLGVIALLFYVFIFPAVLLLNGLRAGVGVATRTSWRLTDLFSFPGGEVQISSEHDKLSIGPALTLMLPRLLLFVLGVVALVPFILGTDEVGHPLVSEVINRPDLVHGFSAPVILAGDAIVTGGPIRGLALLTAVGALFLSLPGHREVEQARLFLGHDLASGRSLSRVLLAPCAAVTHVGEAIEEFFEFSALPIYVTVHLLTLFAGFAVAVVLAQLLRAH